MSGELLLSKVCDENNVTILTRYDVRREDFLTEVERQAFDFVKRYADENGGNAPSYATLVGTVPDFTYMPDISDSYEYLVGRLKMNGGRARFRELFETIPSAYEKKDFEKFISDLQSEIDRIKMGTRVRKSVGIELNTQADVFLEEYRKRKEGKSFRVWKSKFPSVNKAIGGYYSSNMYVFYARSGRGKSVITMEEAIEMAWQGATVLIWALEMARYEWLARAISSISARMGTFTAAIDGIDYEAGFDNGALRSATLSDDLEDRLAAFIRRLNETLPGKIVLRATNDPDFNERGLRQLESDIVEVSADVVLVDPFYYLDYEKNTSKTTGGDAAATSKKLRLMAGRLDVVVFAVTQADEDASEKSDGVRELKPPKRAEIKKTKHLLEDAAATFGLDTLANEGRGVIELGKGRDGGEDARAEIVYLPNFGIVKEISAEEEAVSKF